MANYPQLDDCSGVWTLKEVKDAVMGGYWRNAGSRGLFAGGDTGSAINVIDYVVMASTGNATDFGDMDGADEGYGQGSARGHCAGNSRGLGQRGMIAGGYTSGGGVSNWYDDIQYVTISTPGNGTFFGDLKYRSYGPAGLDNTFV